MAVLARKLFPRFVTSRVLLDAHDTADGYYPSSCQARQGWYFVKLGEIVSKLGNDGGQE
jgi:hypothetical protein